MILKLKKPLCFFDLETTGLDREKDRIIEISIIKVFPDGTHDTKERLINPGVSISPEATEIHGITNEMVKDEPTFDEIAEGFADYIKGCDLAGFNSNYFDVPFLLQSFERAGIYDAFEGCELLDVMNIYRNFNRRTLADAFKQYVGGAFDAHNAEADVVATLQVLVGIMQEHDLNEMSIEELAQLGSSGKRADVMGKMSFNDKGELLWNFGKHKGIPVKNEMGYVNWFLSSDFPQESKNFLKKYLCL